MEKGTFLSADNSTDITYYFFESKKVKPRAVVQITHGMQDYILRYGELIRFLNKNGIAVCGNDDLGHGYTSPSPETDGFFASKDGYKCVVKDLYTMYKLGKEKYPNLPYFMLGHSMGSFFARYFAYLCPNALDGLVLCGTSGKVFGTGFGINLLHFIKQFKGEKSDCKLIEDIMLNSYFKYIDEVKTKREWVTSDPQKLFEYENDPRCAFSFTASAYQDMLKVLQFVNSDTWAKGLKKDLPVFLCSGAHDPVGDYGKGVTMVYNLLKKYEIKYATLKLYDQARHELHNEKPLIRREFFKDLLVWLDTYIKSAQKDSSCQTDKQNCIEETTMNL